MGSGDWNDGLDRVGGESVWLGWFLSCTALRFASLLEKLDDKRAGHYDALSEQMGRAADNAFNGRWYLRAWRENGEALGDGVFLRRSRECGLGCDKRRQCKCR